MQPGVTDTGSVAGARVDQNYVTVDGLDVNDLATGGASRTTQAPESRMASAARSLDTPRSTQWKSFMPTLRGSQAATGPGSGGQFQLVTKSGTNKFHGNINEYHRDGSWWPTAGSATTRHRSFRATT